VRQLITERQHGFISGRSTNTNLACFTQFIADALDKNVQVDCIYTDFSKAFDKINHNVLLNKLDAYGFSQKLLTLFQSYLTDRTQAVVYNGYTSHSYSQTSGVPQESVLGPFLFLMYINDLSYHINCNFLLFADDLKIFHDIHSPVDCQSLQKDLDIISEWCAENDLQLNIAKCSIMTFSRKKQRIAHDYNLQNTILLRTSQYKDLGVTFDERLNFNEHINLIINSSVKMLGFIIRSTLCLQSSEVLVRLYIAYIRSKLEYCVLIWSPFYNYQRIHIEKVRSFSCKRLQPYCTFKYLWT
jgi:ribonuclease P/MRP protein subunit RPP40